MRIVGRGILLGLLLPAVLAGQAKPRGRELGIPFPGKTGANNAITDVPGVAVGHVTLISGEGRVVPGQGPVRTGVTAILTRPKGDWDFVMAATFNQNGNGDMTGVNWIEESGFLEGPILLTGTHSVGTVRDAAIQWEIARGREFEFTYPIVSETFDSLSDSTGQHVKPEHAWAALDGAKGGPVTEGAVGGGTGMICNGFKGGIGTSSRIVAAEGSPSYVVGVLVQCNYGGDLQILGAPVAREIADLKACLALDGPPTRDWLKDLAHCGAPAKSSARSLDAAEELGRGSIVVIVATDAPLLPTQLERLARRVGMGLGRLGSWAGNQSGDLFLAFSTANRSTAKDKGEKSVRMLPNDSLNPFFRATIDATEEAVVNAMLAADTMTGADGLRVYGLAGRPGDGGPAQVRAGAGAGDAMTARASGAFEVKMTPRPADESVGDPKIGRMALDKQYRGDLEAAGRGQMLAVMDQAKGSGGYVALEVVDGTLAGKKGTFALQHDGLMDQGEPSLTIVVVPGSGTGELEGIAGRLAIRIEAGGRHFYDFDYTLPAAAR